jgi:two-component system sensor histidine kinase BarA
MLVVIVVFVLFCTLEFNHNRRQHIAHLGEAYINQLLPVAQWAILQNNQQTLQGLAEASSVNQEIQSLAFYNKAGELLAYRGERPAYLLTTHPKRYHNDTHYPYRVQVIAPIRIKLFNLYTTPRNHRYPDEIIGWIAMNLDTTPIWVQQYWMIIITLFISLISLIFGLLMHLVLSQKIYRPIHALRRSMQQILANTFDAPITLSSSGELGIIEAGVTHLQKKYLNTIQELHHLVDTATSDLQHSHELLEEKNIQLMLDKRKSEEKHKQQSALISNLSHEVRTPLNGIIGFSNLLLDSQLNPLEHDYAKTIKTSAQDLLSIINDILDYSKIEACKLTLDTIPIDIRACIDEVFALIAPKAHKKGLDLIPSTALNVPQKLLGDPLRIKQILNNLIDNAVKFTEHGYVILRTRIEQESDKDYTLCLSVTDTGMGITAEEQALLFQPFHQADSSISRRYGGSGLGLIIAKQLAEQMHGTLVLQSEPNKGSTFSAYLKLDKLVAFEIEKHQPRRFSQFTAVCYDENALYLEALCNGLGSLGLRCSKAHNLLELEQALAQHSAQLAFINCHPHQQTTLAPLLLKQTIPCVIMAKTFIPHYASLGAKGFLFQPPNIQKLHETLTHLLIKQHNLPQPTPPSIRAQLKQLNLRVLIADDNAVNRRLFAHWLDPYAKVDLVADGDEAVVLCDTLPFDAIILDLHMPKLNGLATSQHLRRQSLLNQKTPILLISANNTDLHALDLQQYGIDFRLTKPIDETLLLTTLLRTVRASPTQAIDWALCVSKMSGNEAYAREFLIQFIDELTIAKRELSYCLQQQDWQQLADLAHKIHGACCYFGAPTLQTAIAQVEVSAQNPIHHHQLKEQFIHCMEQIDLVLNEAFHLQPSI